MSVASGRRLLVLALAGMALLPEGLRAQVTLPLKADSAWFTVDVMHEATGDTLHLILDTGAERTAVMQRVAEALSLPGGRPATLQGASGPVRAEVKLLTGISAAGTALPDLAVVVLPEADAEPFGGYDGVLGADVLARFDILISPSSGELLLFEVGRGPGGWEERLGPPLPLVEAALPILLHPAVVNGAQMTGLLDTGASSSFLNSAGASRAAVEGDDSIRKSGTPGLGSARIQASAAWADSVRLGTVTLTRFPVWLADLPINARLGISGSQPLIHLGSGVLTGCPVFIAYERSFIRYCDGS